jgi:hypothetical protein
MVRRHLTPFLRVAAFADAVLGLFALAFVVIRAGWPGLRVSPAIQIAALSRHPLPSRWYGIDCPGSRSMGLNYR